MTLNKINNISNTTVTIKKIILLITLFFVGLISETKLYANDNSLYNFLRITGSARGSALSGSVVALEKDLASIYFNPAVLSSQENGSFTATFLKHVVDINSGNIIYNFGDSFEDGKLAANINFTNYGSFEYADFVGRSGTFGGSDISLGVTYSNMIDSNFYYGITPKFIYLTLEQNSSIAFAIDGGLIYKLSDGRTNIGLSVLHAGTQLSRIGSNNEPLPTDIRFGFNHRLKGLPILFNLSFVRMADNAGSIGERLKNIAVGAEIYLGKYIDARVGFDNQLRSQANDNNKGMSGVSAGLGIKLENLNFDYGFSQYGPAASLHRITITSNVKTLF